MRPDVICPAEHLPFADASFDLVVTRIAPHHFDGHRAAVAEMARVARATRDRRGHAVGERAVEEAERLRDPTHVSSYTEHEWRAFLEAAGLEIEQVEVLREAAIARGLARARGHGRGGCGARARAARASQIDGDEYVDRKIVLNARKGA